MKILVLGNGFIANHLPYEKLDERFINWQAHVKLMLEWHKPDVVVNCIGKTGRPNVDWCESNQTETYLANVTLPSLLAEATEKLGIHMVHIGSGCIYFGESPNYHYVQADGSPMPETPQLSTTINNAGCALQLMLPMDTYTGPAYNACAAAPQYPISFTIQYPVRKIDNGWKETDFANPQSYYSKTKYACDLLLGQMQNVSILRIRMPVSSKNEPRNFINKVRGYQRVIDAPNSMTFADDLVRCVDWVIKERKIGVYHVVNPEPLSAARVMQEYQKYNTEHKFDIISETELDKLTVAKRSNCILHTQKLNDAGFFMTPSEEALTNCMKTYIKNM